MPNDQDQYTAESGALPLKFNITGLSDRGLTDDQIDTNTVSGVEAEYDPDTGNFQAELGSVWVELQMPQDLHTVCLNWLGYQECLKEYGCGEAEYPFSDYLKEQVES
jgi:hypothetical protein